jgi:PAS domain S-box-containing protein
VHATRNSELLRLRKAVEASDEVIFLTDAAGTITFVNSAFSRVYGYSPEELVGLATPRILKGGTTSASEYADLWRAITAKHAVRREFLNRTKAGRLLRVEASINPVLDEVGTITGFVAIQRDVTDAKRAEERLRRSEAALREAQRVAQVGSWEWEIDGDRVTWSDELFRIVGRSPGDGAPGYAQQHSMYTDGGDRLMAAVQGTLETGEPYEEVVELLRADGERRWITTRGSAVRDGAGRIMRLTGTAQDVTERKRVDDELKDAQGRLRALSRRLLEIQETERRQLARELHDELGQSLTAAKIAVETLERFPDPGSILERLREVRRIVDQALERVRTLSLKLRPPLLDDLGLSAALAWLLDQYAKHTGLHVQFAGDGLTGRVSPEVETACFRITQEALTNIAKHAQATAASVDLRVDAAGVHLYILDNGLGFEIAQARRRAAQGSSLGLIGMEERAALAGGSIQWISEPGNGTEVYACFPLDPTAAT